MKLSIDAETLADFISALLGPNSEVAVHDLSKPASSLRVIRNGEVSGRAVGSPVTDFALRMARESSGLDKPNFKLNYRSKTREGILLRSSTLAIKNAEGDVVYMICINTDDSLFLKAKDALLALFPVEVTDNTHQENLTTSVDDVGDEILKSVLSAYSVEASRMSGDEKIKVLQELNQKGLFSIRGSVGRVALALGTSEPTIYRYLKQVRS
ncbi:helix-turn-helix transcriptional regulator [Aeromonas salmonicida]|uniref:helix-turn-helix transcriptional regulator n=1 Tax=Aeromonas salmonicida TaxID=645 RepID=UPI00283AAB8D|nr:PAS domain-containing protein [Aeromonas salmonicida]